MVELLSVIVILAILIALLLPAINAAMRTAKNSAVGADINSMASALAAFKAKYGIYPPSRVFLAEDGNFGIAPATAISAGDITFQQLATRSVQALRTMFPRANFSTAGIVWPHNGNIWYDFNGNGVFDFTPYVLQGHECLVFFLGGIPSPPSTGNAAPTGFGKDPTNPFVNATATSNRTQPMFEFAPNRLVIDTNTPYQPPNFSFLMISGIPGYLDATGNASISAPPTGLPNSPTNFYAYFVSYGNSGYDPNDVNFYSEQDILGNVPQLAYHVGFPIPPAPGPNPAVSPAPNPYTSSTTAPFNATTFVVPTYLNPQTFQIISPGIDGLFGVGGQYSPDNTAESLAIDTAASVYVNTTDTSIRNRERDNITNFHPSRLE